MKDDEYWSEGIVTVKQQRIRKATLTRCRACTSTRYLLALVQYNNNGKHLMQVELNINVGMR